MRERECGEASSTEHPHWCSHHPLFRKYECVCKERPGDVVQRALVCVANLAENLKQLLATQYVQHATIKCDFWRGQRWKGRRHDMQVNVFRSA